LCHVRIAVAASRGSAKATFPNPSDRPPRDRATTALITPRNRAANWASVIVYESPPTKRRAGAGSTTGSMAGTGGGRVNGSKSVDGPRQVGHSVWLPAGVRANQAAAQAEHMAWPHPTMRTSMLASMQMAHSESILSRGHKGDRGGVTTDGARDSVSVGGGGAGAEADGMSSGGGGGGARPRAFALSARVACKILRRLPREISNSLRSASFKLQKTESSTSYAVSSGRRWWRSRVPSVARMVVVAMVTEDEGH